MGKATLNQLVLLTNVEIIVFVLDNPSERRIIKKYKKYPNVTIFYGDLTYYPDVFECTKGIDIILHIAALVSPVADDYPKLAMKINYGSTLNLIKAIKEHGNLSSTKFVGIGTIAMTGDRLSPIHWGRVGDPLKPSVHDYYAVSKIAAEKVLVESGLKYWVSLRQTGILSPKMAKIKDPIIFHQNLNNAMEYVTVYDSGVLMKKICMDQILETFWGHIYNIGGGESCRISTFELLTKVFTSMGFKDLSNLVDSKWFALRNFHGTYYLDSDKLNNLIPFRSQGIDYFCKIYQKSLGLLFPIILFVNKFPAGQKIMGKIIYRSFYKILKKNRGVINWIKYNKIQWIEPFYISREQWESIPSLKDYKLFSDWEKVVHIDHGYDENKPESELNFEDIKQVAEFRGGTILSQTMIKGDWSSKLKWSCAFGHQFEASPRLIIEGGHWCPICERESWNYHEIAKVNPFFAQVWYPLHSYDENSKEYKKEDREKNVFS